MRHRAGPGTEQAALAKNAFARCLAAGACLVGGALAAGPTLSAQAVRPAPGHHRAELCVTVGSAAPNCGPAQLDLARDGSARVRVDDLVYNLKPHRTVADEVVLMHGSVEIDDFAVRVAWRPHALQMTDDERRILYDVRILK